VESYKDVLQSQHLLAIKHVAGDNQFVSFGSCIGQCVHQSRNNLLYNCYRAKLLTLFLLNYAIQTAQT